KIVLAALLSRARRDVAVLAGVAEDVGTELFVDQNARLVLRNTAGEGPLEAVVNHLLHGGDLRCLFFVERAGPANHVLLKRTAVVKGKDVKRSLVSDGHDGIPPLYVFNAQCQKSP